MLCYKIGASETHDASNMDSEHMHTVETHGANGGQTEIKRKLGSSLSFMWKNK